MDFKDYYRTLGVEKTVTDKEIKQAYRKLARKHHPDVNPGDAAAESRFKDVTEAYEVLGDAEKRRKYDALGANWRQYEQAQATGQSPFDTWPFEGGGPWTINFGGTAGGASDAARGPSRSDDPFSDFFHTFFGGAPPSGGTGQPRRAPRGRGRNVEQAADLTLLEAFRGVQRRLSISTRGQARSVDVRIPAGVGDAARIRITGEGEAGGGGAAAGDFFLRVRIQPHPRLRREGHHLHATVDMPVATAVLGGTVQVETLESALLNLKIPQGTQDGQVFRLKGHGMPALRKPADRGDLFATVRVKVPRQLTAEQRKHYEALAALDAPTEGAARRSRAKSGT